MCYSNNVIIPCNINGRMIHSLVYFTQGLGSSIYFAINDRTVNGKSMIGVLSLGINKGDSIKISVVNDDEVVGEEELLRIVLYIRGLGED